MVGACFLMVPLAEIHGPPVKACTSAFDDPATIWIEPQAIEKPIRSNAGFVPQGENCTLTQ